MTIQERIAIVIEQLELEAQFLEEYAPNSASAIRLRWFKEVLELPE